VLYGHGDRTETLSVSAHELDLLLHHVNPENTLIGLDIDGRRTDVLIREIQKHPYRPEFLHVDFLQVHGDETLKLDIPVRLTGTPVGVREDGGVLDQVIYDLHVECLPGNVTILMDGDLPVASVLSARVHDEGVEGDAESAGAEPEVLRGPKAGGDEE
jgi:large subunit ribosomal protein L25